MVKLVKMSALQNAEYPKFGSHEKLGIKLLSKAFRKLKCMVLTEINSIKGKIHLSKQYSNANSIFWCGVNNAYLFVSCITLVPGILDVVFAANLTNRKRHDLLAFTLGINPRELFHTNQISNKFAKYDHSKTLSPNQWQCLFPQTCCASFKKWGITVLKIQNDMVMMDKGGQKVP